MLKNHPYVPESGVDSFAFAGLDVVDDDGCSEALPLSLLLGFLFLVLFFLPSSLAVDVLYASTNFATPEKKKYDPIPAAINWNESA